jgi:hemerythrin
VTTRTLSEIRTILLKHHEGIRAQIDETRAAAAGSDAEHQRACLAELANAVHVHNSAEESALKAILPGIDAWGPERQRAMLDEHVAEHGALYAALVAASETADPSAAAGAIVKLLDEMLAHMAREEKDFLGAELLNDETLCDGFGG